MHSRRRRFKASHVDLASVFEKPANRARNHSVLPFVKEHVRRHAWTPWGQVEVRAAALGEQAALLGAVPLVTGAGGEPR